MTSKHGPRCVHCAQYHGEGELTCPWTGKLLPKASVVPGVVPPRSEASNGPEAVIGQTVGGKYLVRSILGRGGMGTVYEAVNIQIGRVVALKVLHPKQLKKRESVKRFYQEARAAGAIGHPNICEVYDLGTLDNGCPYLVMERLVGSTLAQRMKPGVLSIEAVIDILVQVLSGLVVAHDKGIVHRDLKPENIFLTERVGCPPVAKVLDFGVSKIVSSAPMEARDADLDLTGTGMVMGTPYYMSPEQASGVRDLDGRVDLYACGVILYETLTGRRPFLAANYHVLLWNILKTAPPAPRTLRPDLPHAIESVIARAMARQRDDRYSSAAEFIAALAHVRINLGTYASAPPKVPPALLSKPGRGPPASPTSVRSSDERARRAKEFDDLNTQIERLRDFSLPDEGDAATTLMRDDEIARLARSSRRPSTESGGRAKAAAVTERRDPSRTKVMQRGPAPVPDAYGDETVKMERPDPPPSSRRSPKRSK